MSGIAAEELSNEDADEDSKQNAEGLEDEGEAAIAAQPGEH